MGFIWFIIIGLAAGYIAAKIMRGNGFGLFLNLLLGIIGGLLGGWLFKILEININKNNFWASLLTSTVGAITILFLASLFSKNNK